MDYPINPATGLPEPPEGLHWRITEEPFVTYGPPVPYFQLQLIRREIWRFEKRQPWWKFWALPSIEVETRVTVVDHIDLTEDMPEKGQDRTPGTHTVYAMYGYTDSAPVFQAYHPEALTPELVSRFATKLLDEHYAKVRRQQAREQWLGEYPPKTINREGEN